MSNSKLMTLSRLGALAALTLPIACSGGGGSNSSVVGGGFQLVAMSVAPGSTWQINRPIDFTFSQAVDFSSVSLNTISIRSLSGVPASGVFSLLDDKTVRFQPTCPTLGDLSDSGFQVGGVTYQVAVFGAANGSGLSVESMGGKSIKDSQLLNFTTPVSKSPSVAFIDLVNGPPQPVVRQKTDLGVILNPEDDVTYIETEGGAGPEVEFEYVVTNNMFVPVTEQGLNYFSDVTSQLAILVELDQPVNPSDLNITQDRIYLEYEGASDWVPVSTTVTLERNCSETGATVRLEPVGILPQDSNLRVVVTTEFEDLVGDRNQLQVDNFAQFRTTSVNFAGLTPATDSADEIKENFTFGADVAGSLEDATAAFAEPRAVWDDGKLKAAFSFQGTGGDDGAFDLVIQSGTNVTLDTNGTVSLTGGDIGINMENLGTYVPSKTQEVTAGKINVRHMVIQAGASLRAQGVNPVKIEASGNVLIQGILDVGGFPRPDVATLNTGNQPEIGAAGAAGGGGGGVGSWQVTTSTPIGGPGEGPGGLQNFGGGGGESGFATGGTGNRRPGGGGGGRLGADATASDDLNNQTNGVGIQENGSAWGMIATTGFNGSNNATGAITKQSPPKGGTIGLAPFFDNQTDNNFFGNSFDGTNVILGELLAPTAGAGGGAGGDALPSTSFPTQNWVAGSDEKGCGGGGGGGSLHILSLGNVELSGAGAFISAGGGAGGAGENVSGLDHVGGGSGGGSGGHIVIEVGSNLIFTNAGPRCIRARGGRGGFGISGDKSTNAGGSGGPGLIQVHVLDPTTDIIHVNPPAGAADNLDKMTWPNGVKLVPSFGARSRAQSTWIPVSGASVGAGGAVNNLTYLFQGADSTTGLVNDLDDDDLVDLVPAIFGPTSLSTSPTVPFIGANLRTLTLDGSAIANTFDDIYLRNPKLLRDATLILREVGTPSNSAEFNIVSGTYDDMTGFLTVEVAGAPALDLSTFDPAGATEFLIHPNSFRVETNGVPNSLPDSVSVQFLFEGAGTAADGSPDTGAVNAVAQTTDIADLTAAQPDFIRFDVIFNLDALNNGLTSDNPVPALDFTRIKFRF
jgi:hypothetical protein